MSLAALNLARDMIIALERFGPAIAGVAEPARDYGPGVQNSRSLLVRVISAVAIYERPTTCLAAFVIGLKAGPVWAALVIAALFGFRHVISLVSVLRAPRGRLKPFARAIEIWNAGQAAPSLLVYAWLAWFIGVKLRPLFDGTLTAALA